jgi:hypothetical protein
MAIHHLFHWKPVCIENNFFQLRQLKLLTRCNATFSFHSFKVFPHLVPTIIFYELAYYELKHLHMTSTIAKSCSKVYSVVSPVVCWQDIFHFFSVPWDGWLNSTNSSIFCWNGVEASPCLSVVRKHSAFLIVCYFKK